MLETFTEVTRKGLRVIVRLIAVFIDVTQWAATQGAGRDCEAVRVKLFRKRRPKRLIEVNVESIEFVHRTWLDGSRTFEMRSPQLTAEESKVLRSVCFAKGWQVVARSCDRRRQPVHFIRTTNT